MKNLKNRNPLFRKKPFDEHNSIGVKISYLESQDINNKLIMNYVRFYSNLIKTNSQISYRQNFFQCINQAN